jgi:hypothetical protein
VNDKAWLGNAQNKSRNKRGFYSRFKATTWLPTLVNIAGTYSGQLNLTTKYGN